MWSTPVGRQHLLLFLLLLSGLLELTFQHTCRYWGSHLWNHRQLLLRLAGAGVVADIHACMALPSLFCPRCQAQFLVTCQLKRGLAFRSFRLIDLVLDTYALLLLGFPWILPLASLFHHAWFQIIELCSRRPHALNHDVLMFFMAPTKLMRMVEIHRCLRELWCAAGRGFHGVSTWKVVQQIGALVIFRIL